MRPWIFNTMRRSVRQVWVQLNAARQMTFGKIVALLVMSLSSTSLWNPFCVSFWKGHQNKRAAGSTRLLQTCEVEFVVTRTLMRQEECKLNHSRRDMIIWAVIKLFISSQIIYSIIERQKIYIPGENWCNNESHPAHNFISHFF